MPESDVPAAVPGGEFRYSRTSAALVAGVMVITGIGLITVGMAQGNPFTWYIAALIFGVLWIYQTMVLARFRSTNWLLRVGERGVYIKFRSYLNHHFAGQDSVVAYVPFRDIRLTKVVREMQDVPDTDGRGSTSRQRTVIEIELKEAAPAIADALDRERRAEAPRVTRWYGSSAGKYRHYPVRMPAPDVLAIEWGVRPGAARFASIMAAHAPVESAVAVRDYTALGALRQHEQESRLLELAESGRIMDAVRLARSLYGYDLGEAKRFVDGLSARRAQA